VENAVAHAKRTVAQRAFLGADLVADRARVVKPTIVSAAYHVGVSSAAVHMALQREADRTAIEAGHQSLFPAPRSTLAPPSAQERVTALVNDIGWNAVLDTLLSVGVPIDATNGDGNGAVVDTDLN
jgi:hypothetical protein